MEEVGRHKAAPDHHFESSIVPKESIPGWTTLKAPPQRAAGPAKYKNPPAQRAFAPPFIANCFGRGRLLAPASAPCLEAVEAVCPVAVEVVTALPAGPEVSTAAAVSPGAGALLPVQTCPAGTLTPAPSPTSVLEAGGQEVERLARQAVSDSRSLGPFGALPDAGPLAPVGTGGSGVPGGDANDELNRLRLAAAGQARQIDALTRRLENEASAGAVLRTRLQDATTDGTFLWLEFLSSSASETADILLANHSRAVLGLRSGTHPSVDEARRALVNMAWPNRPSLQRALASSGAVLVVCHICGVSGHLVRLARKRRG